MGVPETTLTILIPIYNGAATLDRCMESLQKQTFQQFNVLCVNDASTDQSLTLLKKWQTIFGEDKLQVLTNQENQGITISLNSGLALIKTPWTARLDGDDWWHHEKLAQQMHFLQNHSGYGLIGCNYTNIAYGKEKSITCPESDATIKKNIFKRNPFAHSTVVFDTALVNAMDGYDASIRYGQDYDLWLRLLPHTKFHNLQTVLCYRNAESSISQVHQNAQMRQCLKTQLKYLKLYQRSYLEYRFLLEPLFVILAPEWLKKCKRAFL